MKVLLLGNNGQDPNIQVSHTIDEKKLEEFVSLHASGNIFQTVSMYRLYQSVNEYKPNYMAVIDENGEIQGLMLSCIIAERGVKNMFSTRSIITGGPLVKENNMTVTDLLLDYYLSETRRKAIYSQCRNIYLSEDLKGSFIKKGFDYNDHFTIIIDLTKPEEELFRSIHKKKRNNIRRAAKKGVEFRKLTTPEQMQQAINLIQATYKRIKLPGPPRSLLENALRVFPDHVHFFGAFFRGELIASKVSLGYNGMIYDWYSGHNLAYSYLCSNDLLSWSSMMWARNEGFTTYDMGGAGRPGVYYGVRNFKMKFGGVLQNTGRFTQVHKSFLYLAGSSFIHIRSKLLS